MVTLAAAPQAIVMTTRRISRYCIVPSATQRRRRATFPRGCYSHVHANRDVTVLTPSRRAAQRARLSCPAWATRRADRYQHYRVMDIDLSINIP